MFFNQAGFSVHKTIFSMVVLFLLGIFFFLFYSFNGLTDTLVARIKTQTGIVISYQKAGFKPWQGGVSLDHVLLEAQDGIIIFAEKAILKLAVSSLWQEKLQLSRIHFMNSDIRINSEKVKMPLLSFELLRGTGTEEVTFNIGRFTFHSEQRDCLADNLPCSLFFQQFAIDTGTAGSVRLSASGELQSGDWSYDSTLDTVLPVLKGDLELDELPLSALYHVLFNKPVSVQLDGNLSGRFVTRWSIKKGTRITGNALIGKGELKSPRLTVDWKNAQLKSVAYSSESKIWSVQKLLLGPSLIKIGKQSILGLTPFIEQNKEIKIQNIIATNSVFEDKGSIRVFPELVESMNLQVALGDELLAYELQGVLPEQVTFFAKGSLIFGDLPTHRFSMKWSESIAGKGEVPGTLGKYNIEGHKVSLQFSGFETKELVQGSGELIAIRPARFSAKNDTFHRFVLDLMTDSRKRIDTPFSFHGSKDDDFFGSRKNDDSFGELLADAVEKQWNKIGNDPFKYLSALDGVHSVPNPKVKFEPGKSKLAVDVINHLQTLMIALKQRPALKVTVEGRASKQDDWGTFSAIELERTLSELYSAINKNTEKQSDVIPEQIRNHLIEQMYLRTQKQKLPEVGSLSEAQRLKLAEEWLLTNWPYDGSSLERLATDRSDAVMEALIYGGVEPERIKVLQPVVDEKGLISLLGLESL